MTDTQPTFHLPDYTPETLAAEAHRVLTLLQSELEGSSNADAREALRIRWTGKNNKNNLVAQISEIWLKKSPPDAKRLAGQAFNQLKQRIEAALGEPLKSPAPAAAAHPLDITLPGTSRAPGIPHPLLETMDAIVQVFHHLGYTTRLGPQVESDFYNFEALNFPPNHPARDTQDTLQIAAQTAKPSRDRLLMRTHTSPVQIRSMIANPPPLRIVIPGKVHRNDAADATHSPIFHQVEGLCVGPDITFSDLKGTLDHAMRALFGSSVKTRFFPSFFPFTEPSADVQISCIFCSGSGCRKCKHSGWIELLGCGLVDPAVFAAVTEERRKLGLDGSAYDPARITGFAFGMGVERIAMILHGVSDIGLFYAGDMRFLEQFA
jgi:phenylalanyl-tRNA synthetase alpha chain